LLGTAVPPTWRAAKQGMALAALGQRAGAGKALEADALSGRILAALHDVPGTPLGARAVVDRLCWRALGRDSDARFTVAAVQRYLLREQVPEDVRVEQDTWRRMLAMRALGADGHDAEALTRALLVRGPRRAARPRADGRTRAENDNARALADFA